MRLMVAQKLTLLLTEQARRWSRPAPQKRTRIKSSFHTLLIKNSEDNTMTEHSRLVGADKQATLISADRSGSRHVKLDPLL